MNATDARHFVNRLSRVCSLDRVLVTGTAAPALREAIHQVGGTVVTSAACSLVSVTEALRAEPGRYSTVVIRLDAGRDSLCDEREAFFAVLRERTRTALLGVAGDRRRWEDEARAHGFRQHPLPSGLSGRDVDALDACTWVLIEAVDEGETIDPAILARYARAAEFIRPNDRVLDLDAGAGAGLAMVARLARVGALAGLVPSAAAADAARRAVADAAPRAMCVLSVGSEADLSQFEDESFDVAMTCRTLPPSGWPAHALAELTRVLTPGGRLVVGGPGTVASPEQDRRTELATVFLPERLCTWLAESGQWMDVDPDARRPDVRADAWVAVFMKPPVEGHRAGYIERAFADPVFPGGEHPVGYLRTFDNPWLHRAVFTRGLRATSQPLIDRMCRGILAASSQSMERAAGLCVLGYQLLEQEPGDTREWSDLAACQLARLAGDEPATIRWRVSLLFLMGRLAMRHGRHAAALEAFHACAGEDATKFSSLLATKTIDAAYWAGILEARAGRIDAASSSWRRGLDIARECLIVEGRLASEASVVDRVELFGCREFSQVFDLAGRCAAALQALDAGAHWESRLARLLPEAAPITAAANALDETRRTLDLERRQARADHERAIGARYEETREALLSLAIHACRGAGRRMVIWGAGRAGRRVEQLVQRLGGSVEAFIDGASASAARDAVNGMPVLRPDALSSLPYRGAFVIVASMYAAEIVPALTARGLSRHRDFLVADLHGLADGASGNPTPEARSTGLPEEDLRRKPA